MANNKRHRLKRKIKQTLNLLETSFVYVSQVRQEYVDEVAKDEDRLQSVGGYICATEKIMTAHGMLHNAIESLIEMM